MIKKLLKLIVKKFCYKIIRLNKQNPKNRSLYNDSAGVIKEANDNGLSICEYVEKKWNIIGNTAEIINSMDSFNIINDKSCKILEIGPGTGRYLEKIVEKHKPVHYEIYETRVDWANWLQNKYNIISHKADGKTLKDTKNSSIDLVHVHGVFVAISFLKTISYIYEIFRVTRNNGHVIFDIFDESCMTDIILKKWIHSENDYPVILPIRYVKNLFNNNGFKFIGEFNNYKYGNGQSKYLIFKKTE